jgi:hypothetical protein
VSSAENTGAGPRTSMPRVSRSGSSEPGAISHRACSSVTGSATTAARSRDPLGECRFEGRPGEVWQPFDLGFSERRRLRGAPEGEQRSCDHDDHDHAHGHRRAPAPWRRLRNRSRLPIRRDRPHLGDEPVAATVDGLDEHRSAGRVAQGRSEFTDRFGQALLTDYGIRPDAVQEVRLGEDFPGLCQKNKESGETALADGNQRAWRNSRWLVGSATNSPNASTARSSSAPRRDTWVAPPSGSPCHAWRLPLHEIVPCPG